MRILRTIIIGLTLLSGAVPVWADVFPNDSLSARTDLIGNASWTAFNVASGSTYTVLYESFNTGSTDPDAKLVLKCGSTTTLTVNSFKNVPQIERFKQAKCRNSLIGTITGTTGSPDTTIALVYTPYDLASTSNWFSPYTSTSGITVLSSLTVGDILVSVLLFGSCMLTLFMIFRRNI